MKRLFIILLIIIGLVGGCGVSVSKSDENAKDKFVTIYTQHTQNANASIEVIRDMETGTTYTIFTRNATGIYVIKE